MRVSANICKPQTPDLPKILFGPIKKPPTVVEGFIDKKLWRLPTLPRHMDEVPLAMGGLTALFGMGRGGDTPGKTTIRS